MHSCDYKIFRITDYPQAIFSRNGAEAGLSGVTAVALVVDGLLDTSDDRNGASQEIELHGLPVDGSVRVGGKLMK